jgi:hypothetical protein
MGKSHPEPGVDEAPRDDSTAADNCVTISVIVSEAYRLEDTPVSASLTKGIATWQPLFEQLSKTLASAWQPQIDQLSKTLASAWQPQIDQLSKTLASAWQPQIGAMFDQSSKARAINYPSGYLGIGELVRNLSDSALRNPVTVQLADIVGAGISSEEIEVSSDDSARNNWLEQLRKREAAATVTVAVFLFVYLTYALAIKRNPELATFAATNGPTPFDAAMACGAFTYGLWMICSNHKPDE